MRVANSLLDLIGETPLVRFNRLVIPEGVDLLVKLESFNPGGSSKDRPALTMIDAAERDGLLKPGGVIVEPTSGNTGVGLAIVAAQRGYRCIFVMSDKMAAEKVRLLEAYGAEVVVCPTAVAPEDPSSYYSTAERLTKETPGAFRPDQYSNPANPLAHYLTTGPEIWRDTDGTVTHFIAGAGTGGTICGVAKYLKEQNPDVRIIAADPEGSVYSGGEGRPYLTEGVGEDFWPANYDPSLVDEVIAVSDADAFAMARLVTHKEGMLIGGSGGTAVAAALKVAQSAPKGSRVVVLVPDSGRGYISKVFNDDWMRGYGFITTSTGPNAGDILDAKGANATDLILARVDQSVRDVTELMRSRGVSQVVVAVTDELPLAAAEVVGSANELDLMELTFKDSTMIDAPIEDVMGPVLETIGVGEPLSSVTRRLATTPALLVLADGRPRGVVTASDVLRFLSNSVPGQ
ncbi:MAG TPA: cystathionine beta-synthase [Acidimicrobiales bacterium]